MWEPNERLLLRAPVRYKKREGVLFVTPSRVTWQQTGSSQLVPSIYYKDISGLQQTPETSDKVLLKISARPPAAKDYTFQFISQRALQERESIKAQVGELLARVRGSSASSSTPVQLPTPNNNLGTPITPSSSVASPSPSTPQSTSTTASPAPATPSIQTPRPATPNNIGSPSGTKNGRHEEFSDRRQLLTTSRELQTLHRELVVVGKSVDEEEFWASPYVKRIRQKLKKDAVSREGKLKGKSSRMVELKPGQQEGSDVKYTLTSQIIHNIFTEFPSVKRAYDTNVPDKMSEQAFWKRFLASEFFHRSRTGQRSQLAPYDDIFDRCLQEEDEENSRPPTISRINKIRFDLDLTSTQEDHILGGNAPDFTMRPGREVQSLPLIRRFNRHSARVLETPISKATKNTTTEEDIEKDIIIQDLLDEPPSDKIVLDIQDTRRYFESQSGGLDGTKISEEETKQLLSGYKRKYEGWQPDFTKQIVDSRLADKVCVDLTITIKKRIKHSEKPTLDVKLPQQVQQQIQGFHSTTNEILRHFWSSWDPYVAEKNLRMIESLKKQQVKLKDVLALVVSYEGNPEKCKQTLMPVLQAVDRALETSKSKLKRNVKK